MLNVSTSKKSIIKGLLLAAFPLVMSISPMVAQAAGNADKADKAEANTPAAERRAILKPGGNSVLIGLSTQHARDEDIQYMVSSLLPTANFLSRETKSIVSFIPNRNDQNYLNDIANKSFEFIYCDFESCIEPIAKGYVPIVKRGDLQRAVLISKAASGIKREDQLTDGMSVGIYGDATVKTLAEGSLDSLKTLKRVDLNQHTMVSAVEAVRDGEVNSLLTSSNNLSRMIGHLPGQFNIVAKSKAVPNAMLLAREGADTAVSEKLVNAFTNAEQISSVLLDTDQRYGAGTFQIMNNDDVAVIATIVDASKKAKEATAAATPAVNKPVVNMPEAAKE